MLATIETGYLAAYAIGQFVSGLIGDRIGARKLVAGGMCVAALTCAAFGQGTSAAILLVAFTLNGFAQSTGWPGTTKAMAEWIGPRPGRGHGGVVHLLPSRRDRCDVVRDLAPCTLRLAKRIHRAGARIAAVGALVFLTLRPGPYAASDASTVASRRSAGNAVLKSPILWSYGGAYFFIKLMRYSILFWLPYYLHTALGLDPVTAGYLSISFEVGGVIGAVSIGIISDRLVHVARSVVAAVSLAGLAAALLLYAWLAPSSSILQFTLMALIGALLFGPDALVSAAAAQDAGGPEAAARATGFVNGVGSVGAVLQGYVIVGIQKAFGMVGGLLRFRGVCASLCSGPGPNVSTLAERPAPSVRLTVRQRVRLFHDHQKKPAEKRQYRGSNRPFETECIC